MHFLCNISYSNLVFSGKKIKNWGHLLNTEAGSFVLLVSHRNPLPGRVQAHKRQKCTAKMGQCDLTWPRGRGKWAQNSCWHISIKKRAQPTRAPSPICSRGFFRILTQGLGFFSLFCHETLAVERLRWWWHHPMLSAAKRHIPPSCLTSSSAVSKEFMVTSSRMNHTSYPHIMALLRAGR